MRAGLQNLTEVSQGFLTQHMNKNTIIVTCPLLKSVAALEYITPPTFLASQLPGELESVLLVSRDEGVYQDKVDHAVQHGRHQQLGYAPAHRVQGLSLEFKIHYYSGFLHLNTG